LHVSSQPLS